MYSTKTLAEINWSYDNEHKVRQFDVDMANRWVEFIESTRNNEFPQVGDIVEYTNKHGNYHGNAHIDKIEDLPKDIDAIYICENPHVPFVSAINNKLMTSTSGGSWTFITKDVKLIGQRHKKFCDWGHGGARGNGAVEFEAKVNVWQYSQ